MSSQFNHELPFFATVITTVTTYSSDLLYYFQFLTKMHINSVWCFTIFQGKKLNIITKQTQEQIQTPVKCRLTYTMPRPKFTQCVADSWRLEENNNPIILLSFPPVFYYTWQEQNGRVVCVCVWMCAREGRKAYGLCHYICVSPRFVCVHGTCVIVCLLWYSVWPSVLVSVQINTQHTDGNTNWHVD